MKFSKFIPICILASLSLGREARCEKDRDIFIALLKEYKHFTQCAKILAEDISQIQNVDTAVVASLPNQLLAPRYTQFNSKYLNFLEIYYKVGKQRKELEKRLKETPLTDNKNRGDLELKSAAINSRFIQVDRVICSLSVEANRDIQGALTTLPVEKRVAQAPPVGKPKMPGTFGESKADRLKKNEAEKIYLSPVDDEFYKTQLGKKLEKDLGGRADFWSYDYETDDLYVKVGNDIGKLSVREESPGIRYIRTRMGSSFVDPRGQDTLVDNFQGKGKFFTKDAGDESLFGSFPKSGPNFKTETPGGHPSGDSHHP